MTMTATMTSEVKGSSPMDNNSGDLHSQITDEECLDMATQNRLMLEMLLEN
jgi:hypothetical protein